MPRILTFASLLFVLLLSSARSEEPAPPLAALTAAIPTTAEDCTAERSAKVEKASRAIEAWGAERIWQGPPKNFDEALARLQAITDARAQVDAALAKFLALRATLVSAGEKATVEYGREHPARETVRQFLRITNELVDLSGRLRYLLIDATDDAATVGLEDDAAKKKLLDYLILSRSSVGAGILAVFLEDPPAGSEDKPETWATKQKILRLIAEAGDASLLRDVVPIAINSKTPSGTRMQAVETIFSLGLPQDPRPQDKGKVPAPIITAGKLLESLGDINPKELSGPDRDRLARLTAMLAERAKRGIVGDVYQHGKLALREGDWLLTRNPSPYNRFTDLLPGLFTHVGVVAAETGGDGIRRFVIVDLPERGDHMPATNVDAYLPRSLHYFFVRHADPAVGQAMGKFASGLIGMETEFDLTFQTDRVRKLKGVPLAGKRLNTYCAGLLMLCAQETPAPMSDFYPLFEFPGGKNLPANLKQLGLSIGDDFASPTGPIFSAKLAIVGQREPMYDPTREIKDRIYDHFAISMVDRKLTPSPDTFQSLRTKLAEVSKTNPWLARALAKAGRVSEHIDLEAAAKAAAVVETLDEIGDRAMQQYEQAYEAITEGAAKDLEEATAERKKRVAELRRTHAKIASEFDAGRYSPIAVRDLLVRYYVDQGCRQLDQRFFTAK